MNFLFWNAGSAPRLDVLSEIVTRRGVNVLALAECELPDADIVGALRQSTDRNFRAPRSEIGRIRVYCDLPEPFFEEIYCNQTGRATIRRFPLSDIEFLLVVAHLPDKRNWSDQDQSYEATVLSNEIRRIESSRGHARTILTGDLNMNPFDPGMVGSQGLHAMMTMDIANQRARVVQGNEYPFFYNPMWGYFGDRTPGPPGTFHYRKSAPISYDWNMLDQVLFRPDVLRWFDGTLEILTEAGETTLAGHDGRPDRNRGSDHFPVFFTLRTE